jgi:predicted ATPase/DNA-binding SARP family transcriptional activator
MKAPVKVLTLGGLKILCGDEPAANLGSRKAEALIVYLLSAQRAQAREVLADMLWDERSQSQALSNLRGVLTILRRHFEPYFVITRECVALNPEARIWFDVAEFEGGLKAVRESGGITTKGEAEQAARAIDPYQGEFLEGFYVRESQGFDQWMVGERERLHHLALSGLADLVAYYLENGDYQPGIAHATRLLELDPLMESAHRQMMRLLALSGKRALALKQYESLGQVLAQELSIEPEVESQQLYEDIRAGHISGDVPRPVASPPSETCLRHNLPPSLTPLVGREGDLENVTALVQDPTSRLVTLAGPGGIGKTRLAIRAAEDLLPAFQHGAWFVRLDSLDSPGFIAEAIARALGMPLSGQVSPAEQVLESLRHKEILLVLDNFEHLLPSGTELLIEILHEAPGVQLLVTSREKLNLRAECLHEVRGLAYPQDEGHEAVQAYPAAALFLQLAQRAAGSPLPEEDNRHIARITQLVEGSPLALELAAVWTRALSCREIAEGIEGGLGFLQANQPDVPERHRSMRAVFDRSWRLLSVEEKAAFRRLSVFRGGFDCQAAKEVAGASLATLKDLVDKSMLSHHPDGRYRMHALLRQYAAGELERAGETEATRERHLAYFLQLAERTEPQLWREQEKVWLDRLDVELDNLRKAMAWSLSPESALGVHAGLRLVAAIEQFLWRRCHFSEADGWLADLLAHPQAAKFPNDFANGLRMDAWVKYWAMGTLEEARGQFERSLAIAEQQGEPLILAHVLSDFGNFCMDGERNLTDAESYLERSLVLYRDLGYQPGIATVLRRLGHVAKVFMSDHTAARSYYREALQLWKSMGPNSCIAAGLFYLGTIRLWRGDFVKARDFLEESLALYRDLNDNFVEPNVLLAMGELEYGAGDLARATAYFEEALAAARHSGMKINIAEALHHLGDVSYYQGEFAKALSQYDEALALSQDKGSKRFQISVRLSKSFVYLRQGDRTRARQLVEPCLLLTRETKNPYLGAIALIGLASLSASGGGPHRAARLWGVAEPLLVGLSASGGGPHRAARVWEAAEPLLESTYLAIVIEPAYYAEYKRIRAQIREQLDKATFKQLVQEGRAMAAEGFDRVVEYALEESRS